MDSNVLICGVLFSGPDSILLKTSGVKFITSDINYKEVIEAIRRKFKKLSVEAMELILEKAEQAFSDVDIVKEDLWKDKIEKTKKYVKGNDQKVLAAVLFVQPDYFVTRDEDFHKREIKKLVNVIRPIELLKELEII